MCSSQHQKLCKLESDFWGTSSTIVPWGEMDEKPVCNIICFFSVDHMGERPHKCKECGETFKHLIVLKRHVNVIHLKIKQTW